MQRTTATTVGLIAAAMILFAGLILAAVGIVVALGAVILLWVGAIVMARATSPDLVPSLTRSFPFLLLAAVAVWLTILYGNVGGH